MTSKKLISMAIAGLLFAGCTMIPKYNRPQAPVPESWPAVSDYGDAAGDTGAVPAADLAWRQFFTDPRLQKLIETALVNNRDLKAAALNVERARAMYRIQRSELLPAVDASGSHYRQRMPGDLSRSGESTVSGEDWLKVGITAWEMDLFGRIRSLNKRALEEYLATDQARRGAQILLISEIANTWLTLAADRDSLALSRSTLAARQEAFALIRRRHEVGVATRLDLSQARTGLEAARVDAARLAEQVARDENALNLLAGSPVPADLYPPSLTGLAPLGDIAPGTPSEVLLRRPDILQAENNLKAAYANIGAARAMLFPRIALTTSYGTASDELSGLFDSGSRAWVFGVQAGLPVFDPRVWSALKVSQVEREIALTQYEGAIQAAFREVADALARKGSIGEQKDAQRSLVEATAETHRLSALRYDKGSGIYLNVLDAQRALYAAEQGLIAVQLADLANQVRLYAAMGGGGDRAAESGEK
ncbi:MAG: efflux transporter outer membrane subunit [Thermodesulfobacteriota bacterium]